MKPLNGKSVVVCDYPSQYLFPPKGYGGIERWLWTVAAVSIKLGMRVILLGPQWRYVLLPKAEYFPDRIIDIEPSNFLKKIGYVDFLVGGHEYWFDEGMVKKFNEVANFSLTYQHGSKNLYRKKTFDNKKNFLFCYSDEIKEIFSDQRPFKLLCVSAGEDEDPISRSSKNYLIYIGRIDEEKSPHYAVLAAKNIGLPIYILGEIVKNDGYFERHENIFNLPHVNMMGVIYGHKKMELIAEACCGIYTIGKGYIEPAAGVVAEVIRSGIPLAGISWKGNDAVCEPVNADNKFGYIAKCESNDTEQKIVEKLTQAIKLSIRLDREYIYIAGNNLYNENKLVENMYLRILNS